MLLTRPLYAAGKCYYAPVGGTEAIEKEMSLVQLVLDWADSAKRQKMPAADRRPVAAQTN
jgi:hypothetical protein